MSIRESLLNIQAELKAPKSQRNTYGNYNYRSCEDILEAVKPHLKANKCILTISDEIVNVGNRYYIKATATLGEVEGNGGITNIAYAREEETKKGMDGAQITGTASSYARKYALNGLFCIDDTKDADTDEHAKQTEAEPKQEKKASDKQKELIRKIAEEQGKEINEEKLNSWTMKQASDFISKHKGAK